MHIRQHDQSASSSQSVADTTTYNMNHPHSYQIIDQASDEFTIFVLGCAGNGGAAQKKVAQLMDAIAKKTKPSFVVLLGDNFYNDGVDSENDKAFSKMFDAMYSHAELKNIQKIPFFAVLGNHDHNFHRLGAPGGEINIKKVRAQVMHSFINKHGEIDSHILKTYCGKTLALASLPKWNMPSRFYKLQPHPNVEFYFLDSNTYIKDYLNHLKTPNDLTNQAAWLATESKLNPGSIKIVFMHHALMSVGKRAFKSDAHYYLNADDFLELKSLKIGGTYNEMLQLIIVEKQSLTFDTFFAAHDHSMYLYRSQKQGFTQVVSGGGGGELQSRFSFKEWEQVPAFMRANGCVGLTINGASSQKKIKLDFYSIDGVHLQFYHDQVTPEFLNSLDRGATILYHVVLAAYEDYFNFFRDRQDRSSQPGTFFSRNISHGSAGVERADLLRNFVNQYETRSFTAMVLALERMLARWTDPRSNSLVTRINEVMLRQCGVSYEAFLQNPDCIIRPPSANQSSQLPAENSQFFKLSTPAGLKRSTSEPALNLKR